jgi:hypothetical protein
MSGNPATKNDWTRDLAESLFSSEQNSSVMDAEATLKGLAGRLLESRSLATEAADDHSDEIEQPANEQQIIDHSQSVEARYRSLVEQIPAVIFMAYPPPPSPRSVSR